MAFAIFVLSAALSAQTPPPAQPAPQLPACLPSATLDQLTKALDDAITGAGDKDRTCLRQLMMPDVRLVLLRGPAPRYLTLDNWIDAMRNRGSVVMSERQIKVETQTFGRMAHLWCTYEVRANPEDMGVVRGINSIQAVYDGKHWHIVEVMWQDESPTEPIPEKYLP